MDQELPQYKPESFVERDLLFNRISEISFFLKDPLSFYLNQNKIPWIKKNPIHHKEMLFTIDPNIHSLIKPFYFSEGFCLVKVPANSEATMVFKKTGEIVLYYIILRNITHFEEECSDNVYIFPIEHKYFEFTDDFNQL